jgi:Holliday junction DNA helicase RuvB
MVKEDILSSAAIVDDKNLDLTLRPKRFSDFIGQSRIKENLFIYIEAAKKRGEPLDHILFSGPPGLGKTTLSQIIANEIGTTIKTTSGPILDKPVDLAGILTNLQYGDILFIDEIHRLNTTVEEYLYSAMEDFFIDIIIDQGPKARSVKIKLPKFTLVGSTTREGLLTAPLRSRFGVLEKLEFYPWEDLYKIVCNSARILSIQIEDRGAEIIAKRSRGTPRIANRFLRRIRDVAQVRGNDVINEEVAHIGLEMLGVDENGLGDMDRKILETVIRYGGGPVGLKTIAVSVNEEEDTIEEVYESFLIQRGYLDKTPRGRVATKLAYEHLGYPYRHEAGLQKKLF